MADADLFDHWFRLADLDRDGRVSGLEAREFLSRSDLSQETLYRVRRAAAIPLALVWCPSQPPGVRRCGPRSPATTPS